MNTNEAKNYQDMIEEYKKLRDQMQTQPTIMPYPSYPIYPVYPIYPTSPCPGCGRCPVCGRGGAHAQPEITWQYPTTFSMQRSS